MAEIIQSGDNGDPRGVSPAVLETYANPNNRRPGTIPDLAAPDKFLLGKLGFGKPKDKQ